MPLALSSESSASSTAPLAAPGIAPISPHATHSHCRSRRRRHAARSARGHTAHLAFIVVLHGHTHADAATSGHCRFSCWHSFLGGHAHLALVVHHAHGLGRGHFHPRGRGLFLHGRGLLGSLQLGDLRAEFGDLIGELLVLLGISHRLLWRRRRSGLIVRPSHRRGLCLKDGRCTHQSRDTHRGDQSFHGCFSCCSVTHYAAAVCAIGHRQRRWRSLLTTFNQINYEPFDTQ